MEVSELSEVLCVCNSFAVRNVFRNFWKLYTILVCKIYNIFKLDKRTFITFYNSPKALQIHNSRFDIYAKTF